MRSSSRLAVAVDLVIPARSREQVRPARRADQNQARQLSTGSGADAVIPLLDEFVALVRAHSSVHSARITPRARKDPMQMSNALAPIPDKAQTPDSWDVAGEEISPVRGPNIKFDAGVYFTGKEKTPIEDDRKFVVIERAEGWQFLKKDCPAEWVMRKTGEPKPEQPFADESTWPTGLDGKPQHPWKYTLFIYLIDAMTGESSTFSSSTTGGRIAIDELTSHCIMPP
jgi:hypothetical protein